MMKRNVKYFLPTCKIDDRINADIKGYYALALSRPDCLSMKHATLKKNDSEVEMNAAGISFLVLSAILLFGPKEKIRIKKGVNPRPFGFAFAAMGISLLLIPL